MTTVTRLVSEDEKEDFKQSLKQYGYNFEDFELSESDKTVSSEGITPIRGQVIIKNKKTGKQKTYQAGHGSSWVADCTLDLKQDYFKQS